MKDFLFERQQSIFSIASKNIGNFFVKVAIQNIGNSPSCVEHARNIADENTLFGGIGLKREIETEIYKIQSARWILRRFALRWLFKRLVKCNTEDIVTLEPIKRPIYIVDWLKRCVYSFEIDTLHKDITNKLLDISDMFPNPLYPKNPLTNMNLNIAQIISVWNTLTCSNISLSWAVTAFRSVRFNQRKFADDYSLPLQISSMKKCLLNHLDPCSGEYILDFIKNAYEINNIRLTHRVLVVLDNAIYSYIDLDILRQFRLRCLEYNYILLTSKEEGDLTSRNKLNSVYESCLPIIQECFKVL